MNAMTEFILKKSNIVCEFYSKDVLEGKEDDIVLFGFKNSKPVLGQRKMNDQLVKNCKKTLLLQVDPRTGDTYLNLNGKKLKMIKSPSSKTIRISKNNSRKPAEHFSRKSCAYDETAEELPNNNLALRSVSLDAPNNTKSIEKQTNIVNTDNIEFLVDENESTDKKRDIILRRVNTGKTKKLQKSIDVAGVFEDKDLGGGGEVKALESNMKSSYTRLKLNYVGVNCKAQVKHPKLHNSVGTSRNIVRVDKELQTDNHKLVDNCSQTEPLNDRTCDFIFTNNSRLVDSSTQTHQTEDPINDAGWDSSFTDLLQFVSTSIGDFDSGNLSVPTPSPPAMDSLNLDNCNVSNVNTFPSGKLEPHVVNTTDGSPNGQDKTTRLQFFIDLRSSLQQDHNGNLPIHNSVLQNNVELVKRHCLVLKARQENVNLENSNKCTPLQLSIIHDTNPSIVDILLRHGANLLDIDDNGQNILHLAVEYRRTATLEILLKNANMKNINLDLFNYDGQTPLIMCCINNMLNCAKLLLEYGADPNMRDQKSGRTALFHAAENHDEDMVKLLMEFKADTKVRNFFGTSPHDAMYEIEEIPQNIKVMILGKYCQNKRKISDDNNYKQKNTKVLRIVSKFRKVEAEELSLPKKSKKN